MIDAAALFEKHDDRDFSQRTEGPRDLLAFQLLHKLAKDKTDNVLAGADHDIIYFNVDLDVLNETATEEDIIALVDCGVHFSEEFDCLVMYV